MGSLFGRVVGIVLKNMHKILIWFSCAYVLMCLQLNFQMEFLPLSMSESRTYQPTLSGSPFTSVITRLLYMVNLIKCPPTRIQNRYPNNTNAATPEKGVHPVAQLVHISTCFTPPPPLLLIKSAFECAPCGRTILQTQFNSVELDFGQSIMCAYLV